MIATGSFPPSISMSMAPLGVWYLSGNGTWLVFVLTIVCMLGVATCVTAFAKRIVGTGSIYSYAGHVFGRPGRVFLGACLVGGWGCLLLISVPMLVLAGSPFMIAIGGPGAGGDLVQLIVTGAVMLFGCLLAIRGLEASVRAMYIIVGISTPPAAALLIAVALKSGVDLGVQLSLQGVSVSSIARGLPLGFALLLGFEGSAALAYETRNPMRWMPRIMYGLLLTSFLVFLFGTFLQVPVFNAHAGGIRAGVSSLTVLGEAAGAPWLATAASVALFVALVGGNVGIISVTARIFGTLALDGLLPKRLAHVSKTHNTPAVAIVVLAAVRWVVPWAIILASGRTVLDVYVWAGTLFSFWWVPMYAATCVGATVFLVRLENRVGLLVLAGGIVGCVVTLYTFADSLIHPAAGALHVIPYLFLAMLVVFLVGMAIASRRHLARLARGEAGGSA